MIVAIGKKIPAVGFVDRESKCVTKFYHAVCNSKLNEIVLGLLAAGVAILYFSGYPGSSQPLLRKTIVKFIAHLLRAGRVVYVGTVQRGQSIIYFQGECKMNMPSSIAGWCTILFFLFFGLSLLGLAIPSFIIGILALGAAVFTLIGR